MVVMTLDLDELTLSYTLKGKDYGKAFDVEQTEYRAVVTLDGYQSRFSLVSYEYLGGTNK